MAEPTIPAAPQAFTFDGRDLHGQLVSFSGSTKRRFVVKEFLKRAGARVEDMERAPQHLRVRLQFIGRDCAKQYQEFKAAVNRRPTGLVVHPTAGKFQAFCGGPEEGVDFARSIEQIEVNVEFIESELGADISNQAPSVATAQQKAGAQEQSRQTTVAQYMGAVAKAQCAVTSGLAKIDGALSQLGQLASAPVDFVMTTITQAQGVSRRAIALLETVASESNAMASLVTDFLGSTGDIYAGNPDPAPGSTDAVATLVGQVDAATRSLQDALIAASPTPASAADAVSAAHLSLEACMTVQDAVLAALPPVVAVLVTAPINIVVLAQQLIRDFGVETDVQQYAAAIMSLNRIHTPASIPAGTTIFAPTLR